MLNQQLCPEGNQLFNCAFYTVFVLLSLVFCQYVIECSLQITGLTNKVKYAYGWLHGVAENGRIYMCICMYKNVKQCIISDLDMQYAMKRKLEDGKGYNNTT